MSSRDVTCTFHAGKLAKSSAWRLRRRGRRRLLQHRLDEDQRHADAHSRTPATEDSDSPRTNPMDQLSPAVAISNWCRSHVLRPRERMVALPALALIVLVIGMADVVPSEIKLDQALGKFERASEVFIDTLRSNAATIRCISTRGLRISEKKHDDFLPHSLTQGYKSHQEPHTTDTNFDFLDFDSLTTIENIRVH